MADQYDYDSALRRRLGLIDEQNQQATTWAKIQAQRQLANRYTADANSFASLQQQPQGNPQPTTGAASGGFGKFLNAISSQESGGNYGARNSSSGAMGKYQIMPGNLGGARSGWDYEALGYDISVQQFMQNPQLQEQIAQHKLQYYYNKYGPAGAAIAWYAGEGAAQKYAASGRASTNPEGSYPSVSGYMQAILRRLGLA